MFREYSDLLRKNNNYRSLWSGYLVSQLGDWFNLIASAALIARITDSGAALSYLFLARFLPLFLFSPIAGVISDRYDRRYVMIASDILRALTVLGFLVVRTVDQIWIFYLLTILQFILSSLFTPARSAVIANIVPREDLVTANALDSLTWSTMLAFGALLGGLATAAFGITTAFFLDAGTFLLSAWLISRISADAVKRNPQETAEATGTGLWSEITGGMQYLSQHPLLFVIATVKAGGSLVWGAVNVFEIIFAEEVFPLVLDLNIFGRMQTIGEGGTLSLAIIYTMVGIGTGLGPVVLRRMLGDSESNLRTGISISFVLLTIGLISLSYSPNLFVFAILTSVRTVGAGTLWVFSAALLQLLVPDDVRGRVFAFEFALLTLAQSISIYFAGIAQDNFMWSVQYATRMFGFLGIVVTCLWLIFQIRTRGQKLIRAAA